MRVLFNYTKNLTGGANGYSNIPYKTNGVIAVFCAVLAFVIAWNFIHSRYGQALSAIRENEVAAAANGINVVRYKKMSFVFSAIYAGGPVRCMHIICVLSHRLCLTWERAVSWWITTVLGGLGSFNRKRSRYDHCADSALEIFRNLSEYRMLFYGIAVVLVILLRPNGLYGYREFSLKRVIGYMTNPGKKKKGGSGK